MCRLYFFSLTRKVCSTDLQIVQGYKAEHDQPGMILGHEFVGRVVQGGPIEIMGKRVVGTISISKCKTPCEFCALFPKGNHCAKREVLGILHHDGCFAEYMKLPITNLVLVPESIPAEMAVFTEPLAAAFRVVEQLEAKFLSHALAGPIAVIVRKIFGC